MPRIDGFGLKIIACTLMLIDHSKLLIEQYALVNNIAFVAGDYSNPYYFASEACHFIGRLCFPIFAFLIAEGFFYTRSKWKYFGRLLALAIISEIPFNMAAHNTFFYSGYQNVFFTLAIGLLALIFYEKIQAYFEDKVYLKWPLSLGVVLLLALVNYYICADYDFLGVIMIFMFHVFWKKPLLRDVSFVVITLLFGIRQLPSILCLPLLHMYNGKRGYNSPVVKYGFYFFYPVHLFLIGFINMYIIC